MIAIGPLSEAVSPRVVWTLAAGGAVYTIGVLFHRAEQLPFNNAVWHVFVLSAAIVHYFAVFDAVVFAA